MLDDLSRTTQQLGLAASNIPVHDQHDFPFAGGEPISSSVQTGPLVIIATVTPARFLVVILLPIPW